MITLPGKAESYWKESYPRSIYPKLKKDLGVDVAIVGGGITGLTAAYLLKKAGQRVAVVEKHMLGSGTTGGTTGKVTSQHGLTYEQLTKKLGREGTKLYAEANQSAIEQMEKIIKAEKIACDWRREDNYIYTTQPERVAQFKQEAKAAAKLGLPASFESKTPLPFAVAGAVKFKNQATFNPQKYILGLAKAVQGQGSYVFEDSEVKQFHDGDEPYIETELAQVTAKKIIVATKIPSSPLLARLSYALFEYPQTSYIVAAELKHQLRGMYISPDKGQYSILPVNGGRQELMLIGGQNHIPGLGWPRRRHQRLAEYAEHYFDAEPVVYRWKAMDYISYDKLPLVGKVYPWSKHLYTATGFKKWGLTTSLVAAEVLHDLVLGQASKYDKLFKPTRWRLIASTPGIVWQYAKSNKLTALALTYGLVFLLVGVLGFVPIVAPRGHLLGLFEVDMAHNLVHLLSGAAALIAAGGREKGARWFLIIFGVVYGLVTIVGFIEHSTALDLIAINAADNWLHLAISGVALYAGFVFKD